MCHGMMLAWCSISLSTITSPATRLLRAHEYATRLTASVALRVNTSSAVSPAPMKRATARRAASNRAVVSSAIAYTPRWTLA